MAGAATAAGGEELAIVIQNFHGQTRMVLPAGAAAGPVYGAGALAWDAPEVIVSTGTEWRALASAESVETIRTVVEALDVALARALYDIQLLKYSSNQMRIGAAASRNIYGEQVTYLMKTTWTEGDVEWALEARAGDPIVDTTVRWKRTINDVAFDHELSSLTDPGSVGDSLAATMGDPVKNPVDGTWETTNRPETREMANGGDYVPAVKTSVSPSALSGTLPLDPVYGSSAGVTLFAPSDEDATEQRWVNGAAGLNTVVKLPADPAAGKNVHIVTQTAAESDPAFFVRLFGVRASAHVEKVRVGAEALAHGATPLPVEAVLVCNGYTRAGPNTAGVSGALDLTDNPRVEIERGILVLTGGIVGGDAPPPAPDLFSLWAEPGNAVDDSLLTALPSNIIHSGNVVNVVAHGSPARPHARFKLGAAVRGYARPAAAGTFTFMNYVKITSQNTGTGFYAHAAPGHAVWYLWRPGSSVWVAGGFRRDNENIEVADTGGTGAFPIRKLHDGYFTDFPQMYPAPFAPSKDPAVIPSNWLAALDNPGVILQRVNPLSNFTTMVVGDSAGADALVFLRLIGNDANTGDTPYFGAGDVGSSAAGLYVAEVPPVLLATALITRDADDDTSFTATPGKLGPYDYGAITLKAFAAEGNLRSLFPPMWYLQTQQGYSPELLNLAQRVRYLEEYVEDYTAVALNAALTSLEKVGLTNELISSKIYELGVSVSLRFEQLTNYITAAISSLSLLIKETTQSAAQTIGGMTGGFEAFITVFLQVAPALLGLIPVIGPVAGGAAKVATVIASEEYKSAIFAERVGRLISRGAQLLTGGFLDEGIAYAMFGTLGLNSLLEGITRDGSGAPVDDGDGNLVIDTSKILAPTEITDPVVLAFLAGRVKAPNPDDAAIQTYDAIADIGALAAANVVLLAGIRATEAVEGFGPFDPAEPLE